MGYSDDGTSQQGAPTVVRSPHTTCDVSVENGTSRKTTRKYLVIPLRFTANVYEVLPSICPVSPNHCLSQAILHEKRQTERFEVSAKPKRRKWPCSPSQAEPMRTIIEPTKRAGTYRYSRADRPAKKPSGRVVISLLYRLLLGCHGKTTSEAETTRQL